MKNPPTLKLRRGKGGEVTMTDATEIRIEKIFDAPREKVWEAWTTPAIIEKWWGPEGFTAPSIKIDLRVGGKYTYAMKGPEGSEWDRVMYSSGIFKEIIPMEKIVVTDYFSDKDGNKIKPSQEGQDADFPTEMTSTILFEDVEDGNPPSHKASEGRRTKLTILYPKPENEAQFEAMLKSGMKEGWLSSLEKMAKVL